LTKLEYPCPRHSIPKIKAFWPLVNETEMKVTLKEKNRKHYLDQDNKAGGPRRPAPREALRVILACFGAI